MSRIALALIKELSRSGELNRDSIERIANELPRMDAHDVRVSFIEGITPDTIPELTVYSGGKEQG